MQTDETLEFSDNERAGYQLVPKINVFWIFLHNFNQKKKYSVLAICCKKLLPTRNRMRFCSCSAIFDRAHHPHKLLQHFNRDRASTAKPQCFLKTDLLNGNSEQIQILMKNNKSSPTRPGPLNYHSSLTSCLFSFFFLSPEILLKPDL